MWVTIVLFVLGALMLALGLAIFAMLYCIASLFDSWGES